MRKIMWWLYREEKYVIFVFYKFVIGIKNKLCVYIILIMWNMISDRKEIL